MPPKRKREDTSSNTRRIDWATIDDKHSFPGFTLKALRTKTTKSPTQPKKKQKTDTSADTTASYKDAPLDAEIVQPNPFPGAELSETHYQVEPVAEWESTQRYRKFTVSNAEFEVGQTIFVNKEETIVDTDDVKQFWVARVLEVRAGDSQHVYLRLYWLYWPEDLPGGRQLHHGENELIASNDMALVDALTVVDSADVMHWEEDPENTDWPLRDQLFWRQTLDTEKPKAQQLSELPPYCIDKTPCNPDEPLVNCPSCDGWIHARCLESKAVQDAAQHFKTPSKPRGRKPKKKNAPNAASNEQFTSYLNAQESGELQLSVVDRRSGENNRTWNVDVKCLICDALIESATDTDNKSTTAATIEVTAAKAAQANEKVGGPAEIDQKPNAEKRGRGRPRKDRSSTASSLKSVKAPSVKDVKLTPAPQPATESVFGTGLRSIKKLLFKSGE